MSSASAYDAGAAIDEERRDLRVATLCGHVQWSQLLCRSDIYELGIGIETLPYPGKVSAVHARKNRMVWHDLNL